MGKGIGGLIILVSAGVGAVGALWALAKATGGEWDVCTGGECTSAYVYALPLVAAGVLGILVGLRLMRRTRQ